MVMMLGMGNGAPGSSQGGGGGSSALTKGMIPSAYLPETLFVHVPDVVPEFGQMRHTTISMSDDPDDRAGVLWMSSGKLPCAGTATGGRGAVAASKDPYWVLGKLGLVLMSRAGYPGSDPSPVGGGRGASQGKDDFFGPDAAGGLGGTPESPDGQPGWFGCGGGGAFPGGRGGPGGAGLALILSM